MHLGDVPKSAEGQVKQLLAAGADGRRRREGVRETAGGAETNRAQLRRVVAHLAGRAGLAVRLDPHEAA